VRTQYPTTHARLERATLACLPVWIEARLPLLANSNSTQSSIPTSPTRPLHSPVAGSSNHPRHPQSTIHSPLVYTLSPRRTIPAHPQELDEGRLANPALAPRSTTFLRQAGTPHRNNTLTVQPFAACYWGIRGTPIRVPPRHLTPSHMDHSAS
jgi:hypothetical protein